MAIGAWPVPVELALRAWWRRPRSDRIGREILLENDLELPFKTVVLGAEVRLNGSTSQTTTGSLLCASAVKSGRDYPFWICPCQTLIPFNYFAVSGFMHAAALRANIRSASNPLA